MIKKNRIIILVSGNGTNMEQILREVAQEKIPDAEVVLVISNKPDVGALERAKKFKVPAVIVSSKGRSREDFEKELSAEIERAGGDWIVLAGFMRVLTYDFVQKYYGRLINIHPSLLPAFPGAHGIEDAYRAGVRETGVTVHFVDTGVDTGPIILQKKVAVAQDETLQSLEEKVHAVEYEIFPEALRQVFSGSVRAPGA